MKSFSLNEWIAPRAPTLRLVGVGTVTWPLLMVAAWYAWPPMEPVTDPLARVLLVLQLCAAPGALLFFQVFACMRLLDTAGAENPFAGAESQRWKLNARALQNSLEQSAIFVPLLFALAVRIDPADTKLLPILVTVWMLGRVLFWAGMHVKLHWRAVGFDYTYYSSALALGWLVSTLF